MLFSLFARRRRHNPVPVSLVLPAGLTIRVSRFVTIPLTSEITVVRLNPFQMALVGTVLGVPPVLLEVSTGIVPDVCRRLPVLTGGRIALGVRHIQVPMVLAGESFLALAATFVLVIPHTCGRIAVPAARCMASGTLAIRSSISDRLPAVRGTTRGFRCTRFGH